MGKHKAARWGSPVSETLKPKCTAAPPDQDATKNVSCVILRIKIFFYSYLRKELRYRANPHLEKALGTPPAGPPESSLTFSVHTHIPNEQEAETECTALDTLQGPISGVYRHVTPKADRDAHGFTVRLPKRARTSR